MAAGGTTDTQAFTAALNAVGQARNDPDALAAACQQIAPAVTKLQSDGSIQYQPAQTWLAKGLADTSKAASECQAGAQDPSIMTEAATDFNTASTDLVNLAAAIRQTIG